MQLLGVGVGHLIDDDQIDRQVLQRPIFMSADQLPDQINLIVVINLRDHDRQVTGDTQRP